MNSPRCVPKSVPVSMATCTVSPKSSISVRRLLSAIAHWRSKTSKT